MQSWVLLILVLIISRTATVHGLICLYGGYCSTNSDCVPGAYCGNKSPFYSQCIPNSNNSSCIASFGTCGGGNQQVLQKGKKCCAGSNCVVQSAYYSQCQNIVYSCINPSGFSLSSVLPSAYPVTKSTSAVPSASPSIGKSSKKICRFGTNCRTDGDCFAGNKCLIPSMYYSQCVQDDNQYSKTGCSADYDNCLVTQKCCNPGAFCMPQNKYFSQCVFPTTTTTYGMCAIAGSNQSSLPTYSPTFKAPYQKPLAATTSTTLYPSFALPHITSFHVNQSLNNVTVEGFNTTSGRKAFTAAVASTLNITTSSVRIANIKKVMNRQSLATGDMKTVNGFGIEVFYDVYHLTTLSESALEKLLIQSVSSGSFSKALQLSASTFDATSLMAAYSNGVSVYIDGPSLTPSMVPSVAASTLSTSGSSLAPSVSHIIGSSSSTSGPSSTTFTPSSSIPSLTPLWSFSSSPSLVPSSSPSTPPFAVPSSGPVAALTTTKPTTVLSSTPFVPSATPSSIYTATISLIPSANPFTPSATSVNAPIIPLSLIPSLAPTDTNSVTPSLLTTKTPTMPSPLSLNPVAESDSSAPLSATPITSPTRNPIYAPFTPKPSSPTASPTSSFPTVQSTFNPASDLIINDIYLQLENSLPVDVAATINQLFEGRRNTTLIATFLTAAVTANMINFVLKPPGSITPTTSASSLREDDLRAYECAYFVTKENSTAASDIVNVAKYASIRSDFDAEAYINFSTVGIRKVLIPHLNFSMYNLSAPVNSSKDYFPPFQDGVQSNFSNGHVGDTFKMSTSNFELSCFKLINKTLPIDHSYTVQDLETLLFEGSTTNRRVLEENVDTGTVIDSSDWSLTSTESHNSIDKGTRFSQPDGINFSKALHMDNSDRKSVLGKGPSTLNPKKCTKPNVDVYYINGIQNEYKDVFQDAILLGKIVKDIGKELGITIQSVEEIYNPTDGFYDFVKVDYELYSPFTSRKDILKSMFVFGSMTLLKQSVPEAALLSEVAVKNSVLNKIAQKIYGTSESRRAEMISKICTKVYESISYGNMVLLVAHSNGNSYMNDAYNAMSMEDQSFVRLFSIATPQPKVGKPGSTTPYVTRYDDLVIKFVPSSLRANVFPDNTNKDCTYFTLVFGHTLSKCYYGDPEVFPLIRYNLKQQLISLTKPATNYVLPNIVNGAISFRLQWTPVMQNYNYLNYDMDLHVIEPDGTRVSWRNMQGNSGFLDQDGKDYYERENYAVCPTDSWYEVVDGKYVQMNGMGNSQKPKLGRYTIQVNYYNRLGPYGYCPPYLSYYDCYPFGGDSLSVKVGYNAGPYLQGFRIVTVYFSPTSYLTIGNIYVTEVDGRPRYKWTSGA